MAAAAASVGHFQPRASILSRAKGHSAAGKAAYNARARIENQRTGKVYSFEHLNNRVLAEHFYAPANAPEWARTREGYWNAVEVRENMTHSQLAMDWIIDLPHQMQQNPDHARLALQDFIRENFQRKGYGADLVFHPAHDHGDERNFHAHLMVGIRRFEKDGSWAKVKDGVPNPDQLLKLRERMAVEIDRQLKRQGYAIRVDHRSNEARGIDREPTVHLGKAAAALERQGVATEKGDQNREIEARNQAREIANEQARALVQDMTPEQIETTLDRLRRENDEARRRGAQPSGELFQAVRRLFVTMGASLGNVVNVDPEQLRRQGATYRRDVDEEQRRAAVEAAQIAEIDRTLEAIAVAEAVEERRRVQERLAEYRTGLAAQLEREGYGRREALDWDYSVGATASDRGRKAQDMAAESKNQATKQAQAEARELDAVEERRRVQERLAEYRAGLKAQLERENYGRHECQNAYSSEEVLRTDKNRDAEKAAIERDEETAEQAQAEARELDAIEERRRVQERLAAYRAGLEVQLDKERIEHEIRHRQAIWDRQDAYDEAQRPTTPIEEMDWDAERLEALHARLEAKEAALRPPDERAPVSADRTRSWMGQTGGYNVLPPELRHAADRSYAKWSEKNPDKAERFNVHSYVSYTQTQTQRRVNERETVSEQLRREARERGHSAKVKINAAAVRDMERELRKKRPKRPDEDTHNP